MHLNSLLEEWDLGETMIRKMTRLANESGAVNLSQGFADYDATEIVKGVQASIRVDGPESGRQTRGQASEALASTSTRPP